MTGLVRRGDMNVPHLQLGKQPNISQVTIYMTDITRVVLSCKIQERDHS
jgi:hypothetical protein